MLRSLSIIFITLALNSCTTFKRCADKFGTGETVYVDHYDTVKAPVAIALPGDTLRGSVNRDGLMIWLGGLTDGTVSTVEWGGSFDADTISRVSESGRLQLQVWRNKYNGLLDYMATIKPDTVRDTVKIFRELKIPCPLAVELDPDKAPGLAGKLWKKFQLFSAYLVLAGIALVIVLKALKR